MTTDTLLKQEMRRARTMGIVFLVFAVGILLLFVPGTTTSQRTTFTFQASRGEALALPPLTFGTLTGLYVLAIITAFLGAWQIARASGITIWCWASWRSCLCWRSFPGPLATNP